MSGTVALLLLREWQHHPWRHAMAALAIALGVALAWSVHVINTSALAEFSAAVRAANGQPDVQLRAAAEAEGIDDAWLDRLAALPAVALASGVVEVETRARPAAGDTRVAVRVLGVDSLVIAAVAPDLLPTPMAGIDRLAGLDPQRIFANASARQRLGLADGQAVTLQAAGRWQDFTVSGHVAAGGAPLLVMDIAAAQAHFGRHGRLSRIDLRLAPGHGADDVRAQLSPGLRIAAAGEAETRMSNLSRAYRVNLSVLAGVALFVGSFLVYSVVALSVAQRTPQWALLGVLGMTAGERRRQVLAESLLLGAAGSVLGLLAGTGMAAAALRWLAGDLGGGAFAVSGGLPPPLQVQPLAVVAFAALGLVAAGIGAWLPAREAERLNPAQALKGLGSLQARPARRWPGLALCAAGAVLALLPPVGDLPLAAYASVGAWLFGGVALVPAAVEALLRRLPLPAAPLPRLALQRAHFHRATATAAVAGVVASLALSVALTVMVGSFRTAVGAWLEQVLPADLYARTAPSSTLAEQAWLDAATVQRIAQLPGVRQLQASRSLALTLDAQLPAVSFFARELAEPARQLPMVEPPLAPRPGELGVYVSEAVVALHGARPGAPMTLPLPRAATGAGVAPMQAPAQAQAPAQVQGQVVVRVLGVWRDYARPYGSIAMRMEDYRRLTGDERTNDLALWLQPAADAAAVGQALRTLAGDASIDLASTPELKRLSLAIFDRSFAVTTYLQAVAIGIGLVGVAASLSAQVLARRKEFGLLAHLGLTRRQITALVAGEAAVWLLAGCLAGLGLGAVISAVLVHVVNPQSFHWTMAIVWPFGRLAALAAAVLAAGVATAAWAARHAAARPAVMSVKEDW